MTHSTASTCPCYLTVYSTDLCNICREPLCHDVYQIPSSTFDEAFEVDFDFPYHSNCFRTSLLINKLKQQIIDLEWKIFELQFKTN